MNEVVFRELLKFGSTLRDPSPALYEALTGGNPTTSGESINARTALTVSAYFDGVRAISEDIAKVPCPVYRRMRPRGKEKLLNHPAHRILNVAPNPEMSPMAWRALMLSHAMGWGNGFSYIERYEDGRGTPRWVWPLSPETMTVWRMQDGSILYQYRDEHGQEHWYESWEIYHLHGLGFDGVVGYSVAYLARETLGLAKAQEKSGAALFGRGSRPGGVIMLPAKKTKEALKEFRALWEEMYGGANRDWTTAILEPGMEYRPISQPNKDAQWIESRIHSVQEVARWLRMPPHMLGDLSHGSYANITDERIAYVANTLTTWMAYADQENMRKLLLPSERDTLLIEHVVDGLLRGDIKMRYEAHRIAREGGWKSANDVLDDENENPIPAEEGGDILYVPKNMQPLKNMLDTPTDQNVPTQEEVQSARIAFMREVRKQLKVRPFLCPN